MIIAWGIFILGIVFTVICLAPLMQGVNSGKSFTWDFKPFLISVIVVLCSAQYIWG